MVADVPTLGVLLDLLFGILMWVSCIQFLLTIFLDEDGKSPLMHLISKATHGALVAVRYIAPSFLATKVMPAYLAFVIFILRYYALPVLLGYDVFSFSAMPLEALIKGVLINFGLL